MNDTGNRYYQLKNWKHYVDLSYLLKYLKLISDVLNNYVHYKHIANPFILFARRLNTVGLITEIVDIYRHLPILPIFTKIFRDYVYIPRLPRFTDITKIYQDLHEK